MSLKIQGNHLQHFSSTAKVLSSATGSATVVVGISGKTLLGCHNFSLFYTLMRADERYCASYRKCDKYCTFEGLKHLEPRILNCHAGLSLLSMLLTHEGHLYGFMLCEQVRAKYQEYRTIVIGNECSWMDESKIEAEWSQAAVIDDSALVASANLLSFIVSNFGTKQQQLGEFAIPPASHMHHHFIEPSRHEEKLLAVLRYIGENLYSELPLGPITAHVYLNANYFSHFFKKRQGVNLRT